MDDSITTWNNTCSYIWITFILFFHDHVDVLPPQWVGWLWYPTEEHLRVGREDRWSGGEPELDPAAGSWAAATIQPWRDWGRRTLSHTHTHTCLMGECVFVRWGWLEGWEGKKTKFWEGCKEKCWEKVFENCRHIFESCFKLRSHLSRNVVTAHDVCLWHEDKLP